MKKIVYIVLLCLTAITAIDAQNMPIDRQYTQIYDFLDELVVDGYVTHQQIVQPYSRKQIANMLLEAASKDSLMNSRQKADLAFYLNVFALERDTMISNFVQYTDKKTFDLSLANPQFSYMTRDKKFEMTFEPILGMEVYGSKKGAIFKRWYGAELRMDIVNHISIWGSLRDISYNGEWGLNKSYYPGNAIIDGAKLTKPGYLNNLLGVQYKEANYGGDFSDSRGGISAYAWFGSISVQRENIRWGDSYHCSNIFSGHNPAVPMVSLQLTPCKWFQFDYFHAWLVSNVLDSTSYYLENQTDGEQSKQYRPRNKFMAANMFTFIPCKYVSFAFGNSIVYAENNVQAAYFIPIAFYKSLDHLLTKGVNSQNQNSQAFASISIYPWQHIKLYGSFFLDEFSLSRLKKTNPAHNPVSYMVGFNWSGWPLTGLSLKGEFMRSYIASYTHSIDVLEYTSNSYLMGHYMGDNAQSIFVELAYKPIRGMTVKINYTNDTKYNSYSYLRTARVDGKKVNEESGIGKILEQKPFDQKIYRNDEVRVELVYEVHPNMYLTASVMYNNARGYDNKKTDALLAEDCGLAQHYLDKYCPLYWQGQNVTATLGFSFSY